MLLRRTLKKIDERAKRKSIRIDAPGTRTLNLSLEFLQLEGPIVGGLRATIAPAHQGTERGLIDTYIGVSFDLHALSWLGVPKACDNYSSSTQYTQ